MTEVAPALRVSRYRTFHVVRARSDNIGFLTSLLSYYPFSERVDKPEAFRTARLYDNHDAPVSKALPQGIDN